MSPLTSPSECLNQLIGKQTRFGKIVSIKTKNDFVVKGDEGFNYHIRYGYTVGIICQKCGLEVKKEKQFYEHKDSKNCSRLQGMIHQ